MTDNMPMIEEIARAIYAADIEDDPSGAVPWEDLTDENRVLLRKYARAAMAAFRARNARQRRAGESY